jgi:hypothetical protein
MTARVRVGVGKPSTDEAARSSSWLRRGFTRVVVNRDRPFDCPRTRSEGAAVAEVHWRCCALEAAGDRSSPGCKAAGSLTVLDAILSCNTEAGESPNSKITSATNRQCQSWANRQSNTERFVCALKTHRSLGGAPGTACAPNVGAQLRLPQRHHHRHPSATLRPAAVQLNARQCGSTQAVRLNRKAALRAERIQRLSSLADSTVVV